MNWYKLYTSVIFCLSGFLQIVQSDGSGSTLCPGYLNPFSARTNHLSWYFRGKSFYLSFFGAHWSPGKHLNAARSAGWKLATSIPTWGSVQGGVQDGSNTTKRLEVQGKMLDMGIVEIFHPFVSARTLNLQVSVLIIGAGLLGGSTNTYPDTQSKYFPLFSWQCEFGCATKRVSSHNKWIIWL